MSRDGTLPPGVEYHMIPGMDERECDQKYKNLSADDPCPDCKELRDENGFCKCPESWSWVHRIYPNHVAQS